MPVDQLAGDSLDAGSVHAPLISVEGLNYRYEGAPVPALNDINLTITAGSCFGLLGPNGAGKTTLISILTGLLQPQQGRVLVGGHSFPRDANDIKRLSALVPQEYAFYPSLSGRENFRFFAGLYEIPANQLEQRIEECVSICGLAKVLDQRSENYSGGVKRRLNLALGLLSKPRVLYLDEPTVGIDAQSRHFILAAIERLKASGMTIIYTSHYMEEVEQICDEVAIIDDGRVLLQESMSTLLQGSRQVFVQPMVSPDAALLSSLTSELGAQWDGVRLMLTPTEKHSVAQLLAALEAHGVAIDRLRMGGHRLEEIYLATTNSALRV